MSRTNPNQTKPTNPAKIFIEWAGKHDQGFLYYYDKETEKKVQLKFPFSFMLLDELSTIKGFNEPLNCGIYSNEIRNTQTDQLHVRSFKPGISLKGLYQELKAEIKLAGAKYSKSLYIAVKGKETPVICNLNVRGISFSAWLDFSKGNTQLYEEGITITGAEPFTNKLGTFMQPVFKITHVEPKDNDIAGELQKQLKLYFDAYFNYVPEPETKEEELIIPDDAYIGTSIEEVEAELRAEGRLNPSNEIIEEPEDDLPF